MQKIISTLGFALAAFFLVNFYQPRLWAEPWLATRYAQNCAACHSPGRRNVEYSGRRCTATCQGCHVNPNGGGLRSEYGKWTEQRFLRTYRSGFFHNKGTPAPAKYQKYGDMPVQYTAGAKGRAGLSFDEMAKNGAALIVMPGANYESRIYDHSDRQDQLEVGSRDEFMARLTDEDPFRIEHRQTVFAGGDFRYFYFNGTKTSNNPASSNYPSVSQRFLSPMDLDLGLKVRPVPDKVSVVLEARSYSAPSLSQQDVEWAAEGGSFMRSAYLLVDDLPYNTYVTAGLYKPLFGYQTADHTSLVNTLMYADNTTNAGNPNDAYDLISARSADAIYKAITVGGAPGGASGKWFYSLNYIMPTEQNTPNDALSGPLFNRETGYSFNVGARFIPFGSSIQISYWSTKGPRAEGTSATDILENDMVSVNGGMNFNIFKQNIILNADYTTINREYAPGASDKGNVITVEPKYRFWREVYLVGHWANSDVANNLKNGSSTELALGLKGFVINGTEAEITWVNRLAKDDTNDFKTTSNVLLAQAHLFF